MRYVAGVLVIAALFAAYVVLAPSNDELGPTRSLLIGRWVSIDDQRYTREFKSDGTLIDAYDGASSGAIGRWTLFTDDMPPEGYAGSLEDGAIYVAIANPESEPLYYSVTGIDEASLEMILLDRGNTLRFSRK